MRWYHWYVGFLALLFLFVLFTRGATEAVSTTAMYLALTGALVIIAFAVIRSVQFLLRRFP